MPETKSPRDVAVAIVFSPSTHRILMVTSRAHPTMWILPKGGVEKGESSAQAAIRESHEEAGTPRDLHVSKAGNRLMMLNMESKSGRGATWHVHVVEVEEQAVRAVTEWPESHERQREWVTPRQALTRIQGWYASRTKFPDVEENATVESGSDGETRKVDKKQRKKDAKGGAMEMALKMFADVRGWGE